MRCSVWVFCNPWKLVPEEYRPSTHNNPKDRPIICSVFFMDALSSTVSSQLRNLDSVNMSSHDVICHQRSELSVIYLVHWSASTIQSITMSMICQMHVRDPTPKLKSVCCKLWTLVLRQNSVTLSFWIEQRSLNRREALGTVEKSQWRVDKSVLLLKESIAIEALQYQYTGRTIKTKRVKDMSCLSGFDQY